MSNPSDSALELLQEGTIDAIQKYLKEVKREYLDEKEGELAYFSALKAGNFDTLNYLDNVQEVFMFADVDTPEERAMFLNVTPQQLKTLVEYEAEYKNDATVFFTQAYYLENAVDAFLQYMRMLDARARRYVMGNMPGWASMEEFTVDHPLVQAYVREFAYDHAAKEIKIGGVVALKQTVYADPYSEYSRSRGELYRAEQELWYYDCVCNEKPRATPEKVAELKQRVEQLKKQQNKSTPIPAVTSGAAAASSSAPASVPIVFPPAPPKDYSNLRCMYFGEAEKDTGLPKRCSYRALYYGVSTQMGDGRENVGCFCGRHTKSREPFPSDLIVEFRIHELQKLKEEAQKLPWPVPLGTQYDAFVESKPEKKKKQ